MRDLGTFGGENSAGRAVNDLGQVVGATVLDVKDGAAPFEFSRALRLKHMQGVSDMVAPVKAAAGRVGEASPPMSNHLADDRDGH